MKEALVLYVEDEENDAILVRLAFQRARIGCILQIISNGKEAVEYLAGATTLGSRGANRAPDLVLLDLNLPIKSGFEVLQWIREQEPFRSLPVVVFTSSGRESDREKVHHLGATDYLVKPSDHKELTELARRIGERYLGLEESLARRE